MKIKTLLLTLLLSVSAQAVPVAPADVPGGIEPAANIRFFLNHEHASFYTELAGTSETDSRGFKSVTVGGYYQLIENLKLGAFYRRSYGLRHDEDWITNAGRWSWVNTNSRGEDFLILDATPRTELKLIPDEHFVGELKTRFINNTFNHNQTIFVRPGITYFWLKDEQAFMNFFLQYEMQFALNYGPKPINERWLYFGGLYRAASFLDIGLYNALKWETWGSPTDFINRGGTPYTITTQTYVIGLVAIFQFGV